MPYNLNTSRNMDEHTQKSVNYPIITPDNAVNDYLEYTANGVNLIIDVHDFTPNEITCRVSKLLLEVVAESNRIGRCGVFRKYIMPQKLAPQNCTCQMNKQGVMLITVPWERCHAEPNTM